MMGVLACNVCAVWHIARGMFMLLVILCVQSLLGCRIKSVNVLPAFNFGHVIQHSDVQLRLTFFFAHAATCPLKVARGKSNAALQIGDTFAFTTSSRKFCEHRNTETVTRDKLVFCFS